MRPIWKLIRKRLLLPGILLLWLAVHSVAILYVAHSSPKNQADWGVIGGSQVFPDSSMGCYVNGPPSTFTGFAVHAWLPKCDHDDQQNYPLRQQACAKALQGTLDLDAVGLLAKSFGVVLILVK